MEWDKPTALLYGKKDEQCEFEFVEGFARRTGAIMTVFEESGHFFHTGEQMAFFRRWLQNSISL